LSEEKNEKNQKKKEVFVGHEAIEKMIIRAAPVSKEPPTPQPKKKREDEK